LKDDDVHAPRSKLYHPFDGRRPGSKYVK